MSLRPSANRSSALPDNTVANPDSHPDLGARSGDQSVAAGAGPVDLPALPAFARLESSWSALEAATASPTQDFIWSQACAASFCEPRDLHPIVVTEGDRATAIASLARTSDPTPRLEAVGVRALFEPMDFAYANTAALEALADRLAHQPLPLRLLRMPKESALPGALQKAFRGRGMIRVTPTSPCPYIALDPSWADPEKQFNSGRRSDFRRARRHAEQLGAVTFEVLTPAPKEVSPLLEEALAVEAQSWKGTQGSALATDPLRARFFRRYAVAASEKGILRMVFMRIAGTAVGMQIAIEDHQRFWLFKIGYDERVSKCSPGTLLMLHSVQYAAARGLVSYEFLGAVAPWTATWTKTLRECVCVRTYPVSAWGIAALGWDGGRWGLERLRRRLRKPR